MLASLFLKFQQMNFDSILVKRISRNIALLVCILIALTEAVAQSGDPKFPTPIHDSSLVGKIVARDLGDARLTHHYYAFKATPGDLLITVNSRNLNGDIDVFTAGTLRPLLKITLYAESLTPVTKGVYLRRAEDLILRIEARSPNDDEGTYRLFFGGTFQPIVGGEELAENASPEVSTTRTPGTRRVSSVGARIEEPPPPVTEVAAAPTPEPTPEPTPVESAKPVIIERPDEAEAPKVTQPPTTRTRRPTGRRTARPTAKPAEEAKTAEAETPAEAETKPKTPARVSSKRAATNARSTKPPPEPEPESGPRLIIETNDGTLINRRMSSVRRVTVENGQVVVVNRDGTINRILLANVLKMAIEP